MERYAEMTSSDYATAYTMNVYYESADSLAEQAIEMEVKGNTHGRDLAQELSRRAMDNFEALERMPAEPRTTKYINLNSWADF